MVANTILQQLGGHGFAVMTGSRNFISLGNGLQMSLARNRTSANRLKNHLGRGHRYIYHVFLPSDTDENVRTSKVKGHRQDTRECTSICSSPFLRR